MLDPQRDSRLLRHEGSLHQRPAQGFSHHESIDEAFPDERHRIRRDLLGDLQCRLPLQMRQLCESAQETAMPNMLSMNELGARCMPTFRQDVQISNEDSSQPVLRQALPRRLAANGVKNRLSGLGTHIGVPASGQGRWR